MTVVLLLLETRHAHAHGKLFIAFFGAFEGAGAVKAKKRGSNGIHILRIDRQYITCDRLVRRLKIPKWLVAPVAAAVRTTKGAR